jgi:phosphohistidine phosphatase
MPGPYELYLIRHGVAEERGEAWPDDALRPLSSGGKAKMRRASRGLARIGVSVDLVLTSPLARTRQTAEILADALRSHPPVIAIDSLAPGASAAALFADLDAHASRTRIALVGHEPGIGELAARLIGSRRALVFKKGAACRIDLTALPPAGLPGELRWLATPKMLRALAK